MTTNEKPPRKETFAKLRHSDESRNPEGRCNRGTVTETVASYR